MTTPRRLASLATAAVLTVLVGRIARAQDLDDPRPSSTPAASPADAPPQPVAAPPPPVAAPASPAPVEGPIVPDAAWRAVADRRVRVELRDGRHVDGRVLSAEGAAVVLDSDGKVVPVAKADVVSLSLPDEKPAGPEAPRYFSLQLSLSPGVAVDLEYKMLYAFANVGVLIPLASSGSLFGATVGAGPTFRLGASSRWHLDLFAHVSPMGWKNSYYTSSGAYVYDQLGAHLAFGIGVGVHFTSSGGWTLAFKVPLVGTDIGPRTSSSNTVGDATAAYYLASLISMPVISFGYRF